MIWKYAFLINYLSDHIQIFALENTVAPAKGNVRAPSDVDL